MPVLQFATQMPLVCAFERSRLTWAIMAAAGIARVGYTYTLFQLEVDIMVENIFQPPTALSDTAKKAAGPLQKMAPAPKPVTLQVGQTVFATDS
jgi:hypothetical protein